LRLKFDDQGVDVMITNFCDFCRCYDLIFAKTRCSLSKKTPIFSSHFWAKIFLNVNPWSTMEKKKCPIFHSLVLFGEPVSWKIPLSSTTSIPETKVFVTSQSYNFCDWRCGRLECFSM
jgi:hypothetical protein